jgi:hypothetical protein
MKKSVLLVGSSAVLAGVALFVWAGGSTIAAADLRQGFMGVNVVHIVGEQLSLTGTSGGPNSILPKSVYEDKWFRANPFATYEALTMPASTPSKYRHQIVVATADHRYWYFVDQNRIKKGSGMPPGDFLELMMSYIQPSNSKNVVWKRVGQTDIDGMNLDLLVSHDEEATIEVAVEPRTNRTYRLREFYDGSPQILNWKPGTGNKLVEVANLRFYYNEPVPDNVFDWQPPIDAVPMVSKHGPNPSGSPSRK